MMWFCNATSRVLCIILLSWAVTAHADGTSQVATQPPDGKLDWTLNKIDPLELRLALAEYHFNLEKDPNLTLGETFDRIFNSIFINRFSPFILDQTELLLKNSQFFQSFILQSNSVTCLRKARITLLEAQDLSELLIRNSPEHESISTLLDLVKSKLDNADHKKLEAFIADSKENAKHPKSLAERMDSQLQLDEQGKLKFLTFSLNREPSLSLEALEELLTRMPKKPYPFESEKPLVSLRNTLREFSKNNTWTASDLFEMGISLNLVVTLQALKLAIPGSVPQSGNKVASLVQATFDSDPIHDIDANPLKPKMRSPKDRRISKKVISDFIASELTRLGISKN